MTTTETDTASPTLATGSPEAAAGVAVVRAFAPASASNIACGFDIFGFALAGLGDKVEVRRRSKPGVAVVAIDGDGGRLPRETGRNSAGAAVVHLLEQTGCDPRTGLEIRLTKGIPLKSGLGSSAASGVAAAVAADALLGTGLSREALLECAIEGEYAACGARHADNAAPCLYGGFVLVRRQGQPAVTELPVPDGLTCALVHPHLEVDTGAARALLGKTLPLARAVVQWGNAAALVAALFRSDWELLASALEDVVAEPVRRDLVPGFAEAKAAALAAGALGCSLSGSGPSLFALCRGREEARRVGAAAVEALAAAAGVDVDLTLSPVGAPGAHVVAG